MFTHQKFLTSHEMTEYTFGDMEAGHRNTLHKTCDLYIEDILNLKLMFEGSVFKALNKLTEFNNLVWIASNQQGDDAMFWEMVENELGPYPSDTELMALDTAYTLFKTIIWDDYLSKYITEKHIADGAYIVHSRKGSLYIGLGEK